MNKEEVYKLLDKFVEDRFEIGFFRKIESMKFRDPYYVDLVNFILSYKEEKVKQ